jgi:hypothetical protein
MHLSKFQKIKIYKCLVMVKNHIILLYNKMVKYSSEIRPEQEQKQEQVKKRFRVKNIISKKYDFVKISNYA